MSLVLVAVTLALAVPLAFWLFDILVKVLGAFRTDDVGADLCLFGVSFNGSTLLTSAISVAVPGIPAPSVPAATLSALTAGALAVSLIVYIFAMILIAPSRRRNFPTGIQWLRTRSWKVPLTVFLGFAMLAIEIGVYVVVLQSGGKP